MTIDAVNQARRLYRHLDLEEPPIELDALLKRLGVEVVETSKTAKSMLVRVGDRAYIHVPTLLEPGERRFAIAHHLGHIVCGHSVSCSGVIEPDARNRHMPLHELEANDFAGELLLPRPLLKKYWFLYAENPGHRTALLAELFGVPLAAIRSHSARIKPE